MHPEPHTDLDSLNTVQPNLRHSSKGSNDAYDVTVSLTEVKWFWVQEKVSEKALRLRKHPTETNIADLATKYLSKHRMEMLMSASNLVLIKEGEGMMSTS